jgi:hypothetical protein
MLGLDIVYDLKKQGCRRVYADKCRVAGTVEIADPYDEHIGPETSCRPGIAKCPGRAGLPIDRRLLRLRAGGFVRPHMLAQHVHHHVARFGADETRARGLRRISAKAQRLQHTAIGKHRIEACQFLHATRCEYRFRHCA